MTGHIHVRRTGRALLTAGLVVLAIALPVQATGAAATCGGLPATITGTEGNDVIVGTQGDDIVSGLGGWDTIDGLGGNDVICGDDGGDELVGGEGDDRLYGGDAPGFPEDGPPVRDTLVPGPGDDLVDVGVNHRIATGYNLPDVISWASSSAGVTADLGSGIATGEGTDRLVVLQEASGLGAVVHLEGSPHADHLVGSDRDDSLLGNGGGDHLEGRGGDDVLLALSSDVDPATAPPSDDVLEGGPGPDVLDGAGGVDVLLGGDGADELISRDSGGRVAGDGGRDRIDVRVGRAALTVDGGPGRDRVSWSVTGTRRDTRGVLDHARGRFAVRRGDAPPVVVGLVAVERVQMPFERGRWTYLGTPGDDRVTGRTAYTARGRGGDDQLLGSRFDDVLLGGPGRDVVAGRAGEDRCRGEVERRCER